MNNPSLAPRLAALLLATAVLAAASVSGAAPGPQEPAAEFPAGIDVVTVDVVVLDRDGNPVEGLTADDFTVKDEGEPQTISSFEAVVLPESEPVRAATRTYVSTNQRPRPRSERTFVIVFDNLHMTPDRAVFAKEAVQEFLKSGLREGDRVALVPTGGGAWWFARMPGGYEDLVAAMERLEGQRPRNHGGDWMSDWEAMRLYLYRDRQVGAQVVRRYYEHRVLLEGLNVSENADLDLGNHSFVRIKATEVYLNALGRLQATMRTLERVAESLVGVSGRKSILLVSEGFIHEPSRDEFKVVAEAARRANAAVYFFDARGLTGLPFTADAERAEAVDLRDLGSVLDQTYLEASGAETVAADTGGFTMKNRNDLAAGLRQVARESRAYYLVGYNPTNRELDGKFRKIEVQVDRPDVTIRARKGYYALPKGETIERGEDEDVLDPTIRRALDSPYSSRGIPLRMTSYVLGPAGEGKTRVLVVSEADPRALRLEEKDGRFKGTLESFVMVASRERGERFHRERQMQLSLPPPVLEQLKRSWVPIIRDFELVPGVYQARLMLQDREGGSLGTVRHEFEVPETGQFRTSTPVLTDTLQPSPEGSQMPPRPVPIARRTFATGKRLFYAVEVFGARPGPGGTPPSVRSGYVVRRSDGSTVVREDAGILPPGPGGRLARLFSFPLEGMAPGDYEIVFHVTDEVAGQTLEVVDPFSVTTESALSGLHRREPSPRVAEGGREAPRR